jgi:hypothetical protein
MPERTPSTPPDARRELARQQAAVVRAIQLGEPAPVGFDTSRLHSAEEALSRKRMRSVQQGWRGVAGALGEQFRSQFDAYAAKYPTPQDAGADGYQFARWLKSNGSLSSAGRIELAQWEVSHGAIIRILWLRDTRLLIVVYRRRHVARLRQIRWFG